MAKGSWEADDLGPVDKWELDRDQEEEKGINRGRVRWAWEAPASPG